MESAHISGDEIAILDACAGAGMLGEAVRLGLEAIGFRGRIICHIERDAAAAATIVSMFGDAPIWDELATFDGTAWRGCVDIACAGLPCPAYSLAGKRIGNDDARAWGEDGESGPVPQFLRIVSECLPAMVFCENVPAWVTAGWFRRFGDELCRLGYEIEEPLFLAASDVGAPHERERVFVLAHRLADAEFRGRWIDLARRGSDRRGIAGWTSGEVCGDESCDGRELSSFRLGSQCPSGNGKPKRTSGCGRNFVAAAGSNQLADNASSGRSTKPGQPGGTSEAIRNAASNNEELADGAGAGSEGDRPAFQRGRGRGQLASERDRELGNAERTESRAGAGVEQGESTEHRRDRPANANSELGNASLAPGSAEAAGSSRLIGRGEGHLQGCCELPLFPPGRGDESNPDHPDWWAWAAVAEMAPAAMPRVEQHIPALADGMARADELRIGGNGVVTLAAAYAFATQLASVIERSRVSRPAGTGGHLK